MKKQQNMEKVSIIIRVNPETRKKLKYHSIYENITMGDMLDFLIGFYESSKGRIIL